MGKFKFSDKRLEDKEFELWLGLGNNCLVCTVWHVVTRVASVGINVIWSHMLSASNKAPMGRRQQASVMHFCATPLKLACVYVLLGTRWYGIWIRETTISFLVGNTGSYGCGFNS